MEAREYRDGQEVHIGRPLKLVQQGEGRPCQKRVLSRPDRVALLQLLGRLPRAAVVVTEHQPDLR